MVEHRCDGCTDDECPDCMLVCQQCGGHGHYWQRNGWDHYDFDAADCPECGGEGRYRRALGPAHRAARPLHHAERALAVLHDGHRARIVLGTLAPADPELTCPVCGEAACDYEVETRHAAGGGHRWTGMHERCVARGVYDAEPLDPRRPPPPAEQSAGPHIAGLSTFPAAPDWRRAMGGDR
jgi:hypothetical protein